MSTATDKDRRALGLAIFSAIVSVFAIGVSGYFAWKQDNLSQKVYDLSGKQYDLSQKVFSQSQEDLQLFTMIDQKSPIDLEPPREMTVAGSLNDKMQSLPSITMRYNALLSNRSLITVIIKSYQVACKTLDGKMWSITIKSPLTILPIRLKQVERR